MSMSIDAVIRDALQRHPDVPARVVAKQIAAVLTAEQIEPYFVELLATHIDDMLRLTAATARNNALGPRRSWKHGRGRSPWHQMCDSTVWVNGEPRRTGACSRADLIELIAVRRTQVDHLNHQILNFEKLIELLDHHHVTFVDDIPEEALAV